MKIAKVKHIEDCFDGSYIHEILFDTEITCDAIKALGCMGDLQYYPYFARPFFKIIVDKRFSLKGVEGNRTMRILSYEKDMDSTLKSISDAIAAFDKTELTPGGKAGT